ncbi:MAG: imidazolonepropionase [Microbacteriaceae bacterium]|jgi:imidazolonepropionase|nr:imidazolonepropionase [Microbacteriaceae bacterium]MCI1207411.1 imidazolonepropionase [Microbacteriaceae bacterium]
MTEPAKATSLQETELLVTGIRELVTNDPSLERGSLGLLHNAWVLVRGDRIAAVGDGTPPAAPRRLDVGGRCVLPGFVDSHTHLLFAGDRSEEFAARMRGEAYSGGGIRVTVRDTRAASDAALRAHTAALVAECHSQGTTTLEMKSGYGLTVADEARLLRLAAEFTDEITFLGAHAVPAEYADDPDAYVDLVCERMLPQCAPLAKWVDVFCEPHSSAAFDADQTSRVLEAATQYGLRPRLHGAQLGPGPGPELAVRFHAASVDHSTYLSDADIDRLAAAAPHDGPVVTFMPIVEFSTRHPYPDARRPLDAGVTVALASDCNPGTCFSSSMPLTVAMAVRDLGMTPDEAIWAATAGGAAALRRTDIGILRPGARADLALLDAPSRIHLAYRPGVPLSSTLLLGGVPTPAAAPLFTGPNAEPTRTTTEGSPA